MRIGTLIPVSITFSQRRWINSAHIALEARDFLNPRNIADGAVYDQSVVTFGVDRRRQIVADNCAVADFSEQIDDQNVARFQNVDDPRVLVANAIFFFAVGANHRIHIRTLRHEHRRHHPADKPRSRVDHLPSAFELVAITGILQHIPSFVGGDILQTRQHSVPNIRTSVRKAIAVPIRREFNSLLFRKKIELCMRRKNQRKSQRTCDHNQSGSSHRFSASPSNFIMTANVSQRSRYNNYKSGMWMRFSASS